MERLGRIVWSALVVFAASSGWPSPATPSPPETRERSPFIRVVGEAFIEVKPDRAEADIEVVTQAKTAEAAATENAARADAVFQALRRTLGAEADIRTTGYRITPLYRLPREGEDPVITGYEAANMIRVRIDDLTRVGPVIDAATGAGANKIPSLRFTLRDEQAVRAQALAQATAAARAKGEAIASALGVKINRAVSAEEIGEAVQPLAAMALGAQERLAAPTTPIEPGTIEVRAQVTLTVEISAETPR